MLNDKPYLEVNREERFYCFLFAHALLSSEQVKRGFADLIDRKFSIRLNLADLEVYLEAAVLRDYWHDLGDPVRYSCETHVKREAVVAAILNYSGLPEALVRQHQLFWTTRERHKLWSPGRWSERALGELGLDKLIRVKWAFNAKPDIMIVSGPHVLLIEAKVVSGIGRNARGYEQPETQKLVARLLELLAPQFKRSRFLNTSLELRSTCGIVWEEILAVVEGSGIDEFSKRCLLQLRRFI